MPNSKMRSFVWFLAKAAVSIAFLCFATRKIDFSSFAADVRSLKSSWLFLGLGQFLLIPVLGGQRWRLVLHALGSSISMKSSLRLFWIGMIFSQVLPSGGDAIRVVLAWRGGVPLARSAHSVILERLAMLFTLIALVAFMQSLGGDRINLPGPSWSGALLLSAAAIGMLLVTSADAFIGRLPPWKAVLAVSELSFDARRVFFSASCAGLAASSLLTHLNIALGCLWLGKAIGLHLSTIDYVFYISLITLVTSLPLSIGGWGIREGAVVTLFGIAGVSPHSALAFSILFGLSVGAVSLVGLPFVSFKKAAESASEDTSSRKFTCPT